MITPNWKPAKGTAMLEARQRRSDRVAHEQREMQAALKRDERKCRVPHCEYAGKKLPIDPCHKQHRGMGGNPSGDRTTQATIIALCRIHHGLYDKGVEFDISPKTAQDFDGPCDYLKPDIDGRWFVFASERVIGVSVERNS